MTVNAAVPKDLFDDIAIIGNQAVVELTMTIGFYNMSTRYLRALDIQLENP